MEQTYSDQRPDGWTPYEDPTVPLPTKKQIVSGLLHCHDPFVIEKVSKMKSEAARTQAAQPADTHIHANALFFEYAEHASLGDTLNLQWSDGTSTLAKDHTFHLPNGLKVTYGQINALAGQSQIRRNHFFDRDIWPEKALERSDQTC